MIKYVMATIMLIVAVSRLFALPKYLTELQLVAMNDTGVAIMTKLSFGIMCFALLVGATIILANLFKARRMEKAALLNA